MRVTEEFLRRHGRPPAVVASAPGRVNLIGEHLDYNGGLALPMPLALRTTVAAAPRADRLVTVTSLQCDRDVVTVLGGPRTEGWAAYVVGVIQALGDAGAELPGLDLVVDGEVPLGAGLASSAALEAAVAVAVLRLLGDDPDPRRVVDTCVRAENDYVGAPTGRMDQMAVVLCSAEQALLVDFATGRHRPVRWSPPGDLLVVDTGVGHAHATGEYAVRRRECAEAARLLGTPHLAQASAEQADALPEPLRARARHVVTEQARVLQSVAALEAEDWECFGDLLVASHASLRDDYQVSCRELDLVVDASVHAGATGARMTGGGFGGCALVLCPPGRTPTVRDGVLSAFREQRLRTPTVLVARPGHPARVDAVT